MKNNQVPEYLSPEWHLYQYEQSKIAKRGHNYQYWSDYVHRNMLDNGWDLFEFNKMLGYERHATNSELIAIKAVEKLRTENNFARIVAGLVKNRQRTKMFSVIYKPKK